MKLDHELFGWDIYLFYEWINFKSKFNCSKLSIYRLGYFGVKLSISS